MSAKRKTSSVSPRLTSKTVSQKLSSRKTASANKKSTKAKADISFSADAIGLKRVLDFPVVGIGSSAGGLDALQELFTNMPAKTGMAFVIVSHLDPSHVSLLPELLQRTTKMKVYQIRNNIQVKPDCVYIIPPNKNLKIIDGSLCLKKLTGPRGINLPIDSFFRSLADDQGANAVAIVLSGTGSDGTLGVRAVKGELGLVIVQDEESSKYDGMPRNAINTGLADYILPPAKIPNQLIKYKKHFSLINVPAGQKDDSKISDAIRSILSILRVRTHHDFSLYKKNTIYRRIERRMNVQQIEKTVDYMHFLRENEHEVDILFKDLLIGVTSFFRNPEAFKALKKELISKLQKVPDEYNFRVWVPGCSSGEEVYSIAIMLHEVRYESKKNFSIQIFGTDIDNEAIESARTGLYPPSIAADVEPERLNRYFTKEDDGKFRIRKMIREVVVFATQNIIKDPPFTKMDMLSCRNLLIYFGSELQKKLFPIFHYSLKPEGILVLGSSETVGQANDLFTAIDKKWKVFMRKSLTVVNRTIMSIPVQSKLSDEVKEAVSPSLRAEDINSLQLIETILQESKTPPSVIIDNAGNAVYIYGRTGRYLEPAEGAICTNITEMARPGLKSALIAAIKKVKLAKKDVIIKDVIVLNNGGEPIKLDLIVKPVIDNDYRRDLMMVQFQEISGSKKSVKAQSEHRDEGVSKKTVDELERELRYTKENLQTTIEELETSNEELKSTNEELQSANEELQSTNEEMETSKEELQSLNEESITVNAELQSRIDELSKANDDMKNLFDSTDLATIFLDDALCLRRFTSSAKTIVPLTAMDIGRPISHFANNLINVDLAKLGESVLDDLAIRNVEAESKDGRCYQLRFRPYRTVNNVIDGVVITFNDITENRQAGDVLRASEKILRQFMKSATYGFILVGENLKHIEINDMALKLTGMQRKDLLKMQLGDILPEIENEEKHEKYLQVLKTGIPFYDDNLLLKSNKKVKQYVELTTFKVGNGLGIILNDINARQLRKK